MGPVLLLDEREVLRAQPLQAPPDRFDRRRELLRDRLLGGGTLALAQAPKDRALGIREIRRSRSVRVLAHRGRHGWGIGIARLAMVALGLNDVRELFDDDLRRLEGGAM